MSILTGLALLLLLAGTTLLSQRLYVWDAGLLIAVSLTFIVGRELLPLIGRRLRHGRMRAALVCLVPKRVEGWIRLVALLVSSWVARAARLHPLDQDFTGFFVTWLAAVVAFAATVFLPLLRARILSPRLSRSEGRWLVALLIAAALLRGVGLGRIPTNLGGDEGTQLVVGLEVVRAPLGNVFSTGWYSVPAMSMALYGFAMRIFGASVAGGRALSAIAGTATVLTTFLMARALGGRRVGWLAGLVLAFSAYHIHFSRLASNQIFDPLVGTLALWLLWIGLQRARPKAGAGLSRLSVSAAAWAMVGLIAGLGWYGYFGARWVSVLVGAVLVWRALVTPRFLRRHWRGLVLLGMGWLVAVLPLMGWYTVYPSALTERVKAVNIFSSGWLAREVEITQRPAWELVLDQTWRALTAFHLTPDRTFWYFPERPLVDSITGALLLIGLVAVGLRLRWPSRALVLGWFLSTVLTAWAITESPPSSQRGLLIMPAVAILAAWGVEWALERMRDLAASRRLSLVALSALVTAMALANCVFYFGLYTPRRIYGNPSAEKATAFARYSLANPEPVCPAPGVGGVCRGRVYFVGPPTIVWDFGTLKFMMRWFPGEDVPLGEIPTAEGPARFAIVPDRVNEIHFIRSRHPGGRETVLRNPRGELLMLIYDWPGPG